MFIKSKYSKFLPIAMGVSLGLGAGLSQADLQSIQLENGSNLSVNITDPAKDTEFKVPASENDIDVNVVGVASIGTGDPDATIIYVIDESGSTNSGGGSGCSPILDCEKKFFKNLNLAAIADGSTDLVGVVHYANSANIALSLTNPMSSLVDTAIDAASAGGGTNCAAGIASAQALATTNLNGNGTTIVVFASDGFCNSGGLVSAAVSSLTSAKPGVIIQSVAIGAGSSCTSGGGFGSTGTLSQITANGGMCQAIPDPGNFQGLIKDLIGSTLINLESQLNGSSFTTLPAFGPVDGAADVDFNIPLTDLIPDDYTVEVRATGEDASESVQMVTDSHTFHLLQLTASPDAENNDLNVDDEHTVTAAIAGGTGPDRDIDFNVSGQNASTATPGLAALMATPGGASVSFAYSVPQDCASLGTDTITVSTTIAGMDDEIEVTKNWFDDTPPNVSCDPTVNPNGNNEPSAPGNGGQGQNQDGFYQLNAEDPNLANCTVTLAVTDGDGYEYPGPFALGDNIKYTQDDDEPQQQKKMGSGNGRAGAVRYHLKGHGDLTVTATDPSGNFASASCLVPPAPQ